MTDIPTAREVRRRLRPFVLPGVHLRVRALEGDRFEVILPPPTIGYGRDADIIARDAYLGAGHVEEVRLPGPGAKWAHVVIAPTPQSYTQQITAARLWLHDERCHSMRPGEICSIAWRREDHARRTQTTNAEALVKVYRTGGDVEAALRMIMREAIPRYLGEDLDQRARDGLPSLLRELRDAS